MELRIGDKFGKLTIIEEPFYLTVSDRNVTYCKCKCECGRESVVRGSYLINGHTKSCGKCSNVYPEVKIGNRYNKLVVIDYAPSRRTKSGDWKKVWKCKCDCGNITMVDDRALKNGKAKSCGCIKLKHRLSGTKIYKIYCHMIDGCYNPKDKRYKAYGAKGIKISPEWYDPNSSMTVETIKFREFVNWVYRWLSENGYHDIDIKGDLYGLNIDRIDPNSDFSPENCRFIDSKNQSDSKTNNIVFNINGSMISSNEINNILGVNINDDEIKYLNGDTYRLFDFLNTNHISHNAIFFTDRYGYPISEQQYDRMNNEKVFKPAIYETNEKGFIIKALID